MRSSAPDAPGAAASRGNSFFTKAAVGREKSDAATYLHTTAITRVIRSEMGLPAYQMAGKVSTQNETLHAVAMPTGPHRRPAINSAHVTANSTIAQRNQRSARPMER